MRAVRDMPKLDAVRIPRATLDALRELADDDGVSLSQYVREVLAVHVDTAKAQE